MTLTELLDLVQTGWITVVDRDTELRTDSMTAFGATHSSQLKTLVDKKVASIRLDGGTSMTVEVAS